MLRTLVKDVNQRGVQKRTNGRNRHGTARIHIFELQVDFAVALPIIQEIEAAAPHRAKSVFGACF